MCYLCPSPIRKLKDGVVYDEIVPNYDGHSVGDFITDSVGIC